jgi:hypothetical protein
VDAIADKPQSGSGKSGGKPGNKTDVARAFLQTELAKGPQAAAELQRRAHAHGINERTLSHAKNQCPISTYKDGMAGGWIWAWGYSAPNDLPPIFAPPPA